MPIFTTQTAEPNGNLAATYQPFIDGELEGLTAVQRAAPGGRWGRQPDPAREARVAAATELMTDILTGRAPAWAFKEAMQPSHLATLRAINGNYPGIGEIHEAYGVSDFPNLLGDVLDRMLLDRFREFPQGWRQYIRVARPLRDFRTVRRLSLDGAEGQYVQIDDMESLDYSRTLAENNYTYSPELYALGVKLTFRTIMDDDLDAFDSIPNRLGRGGRRTIAKFATDLLFDASGPDGTHFASGNNNVVGTNMDLAMDALAEAFELLLEQTDADAEPILVEGVTLVVPPALWVTANNLVNQLTVDVSERGGSTTQVIRVNNWLVRDLTLVMDPYIPIVCTSNGDTSWILVANPAVGRPTAEIGFLAGFEEPQLYRKAGNSVRVGGSLDQNAGDFETMAQHYKGVVAFGGTLLDPKAAVGSDGSNS